MINAKTRLINALQGMEADRPPFVCPGGMMNMVTAEILQALDLSWPKVYGDPAQLARLALKVSEMSGIENLGVPFCMTLEAEALGAEIEMGSLYTEPRVVKYPLSKLADWQTFKDFDLTSGRMAVLRQAVNELAQANSGLPIIVSLTGPLSLAMSLIEPMTFFRSMRTEKNEIHAFLSFLSENLSKLAEVLAQEGADILAIADPSASGEIVGPTVFDEFALPYINRIIQSAGSAYQTSLVHICGRLNSIFHQVNELAAPAVSIDSATSVAAIRRAVPGKVIIGNVSTQLLQTGDTGKVKKAACYCMAQGVAVLAPACGLSMSTPLSNLQAMAAAAREWPGNNLNQELIEDEPE